MKFHPLMLLAIFFFLIGCDRNQVIRLKGNYNIQCEGFDGVLGGNTKRGQVPISGKSISRYRLFYLILCEMVDQFKIEIHSFYL